jgi:transcriptional regulator with XRE-family HTH domain
MLSSGGDMARYKRPSSVTEVQREVGQRIRWARECVEPNRAAFARLMGVDRTTLQKIEDGDRPPSIFNVLEIAHRLRVTCDFILTGSLRGVDGELAALLVSQHPELAPSNSRAKAADTFPKPKTPDAVLVTRRRLTARD